MALPPIPKEILKLLPKIAKGTVKATRSGWAKTAYYDPITGSPITFFEKPTVVCVAELRSGRIPSVAAPTISIPSITLPKAPAVSIPPVSLPRAPTIRIPSMAIPKIKDVPRITKTLKQCIDAVYHRLPGGALEWTPAPLWGNWRNALAQAGGRMLYLFQEIVVTPQVDQVRNAINAGLSAVRSNVQTALNAYRGTIQASVNAGLSDARSKTQSALNAYSSRIQSSVNSGLADARNKTQAALNAYRDSIQRSVNSGLSAIIPTMYSMMGLPDGQLISPVNLRNVHVDSFEFYALSSGMILHYVAVGR